MTRDRDPNAGTLLGRILHGAPALPAAKCVGRPHLFDPAERDEHPDVVEQRHLQALGLCQHCPALDDCRRWIEGLRPSQRPAGVVGGEIREPARPVKRPKPRKEAS